MQDKMSARQVAVISLMRMQKEGRYSNLEVDSAIKKYGLNGAEKSLYVKLLYGVLERMYTLDYLISLVSDRKIEDTDDELLNILRITAYQIHCLDKIPVSAACNEAVKLASRRSDSVKGFINAVSRALSRLDFEKELVDISNKYSGAKYLSVKYSISPDIAELLLKQYPNESESIISNMISVSENTLRVNTLKASVSSLCEKLDAVPSPLCDSVIRLRSLPEKEGFATGEYFVQSEPSYICAKAVGANPGDFIIDACACPGGKTFSIAINMQNKGMVLACDLHKNKLSLIEREAHLLGIDIITTKELDGRTYEDVFAECADAVLCDVPCSGIGSIAKKPDIRYKNMEDAKRLPQIQFDILNNNAKYVKHGGVIVYSTCTLNKAENTDTVKRFLEENDEFEPVGFEINDKFKTVNDGSGYYFIPSESCPDGFYISKMRRK